MVESLQKGRDAEGHDAAHDVSDGQHDEGNINREARMIEQRVENDTDALAAIDEAEAVESDDEEERRGAMQACGQDGEDGEK